METALISQLPEWGAFGLSLGVLVYIMRFFMAYIEKRDVMVNKIHNDCEDKIKDLTVRCMEKMDKNTEVLAKVETKL